MRSCRVMSCMAKSILDDAQLVAKRSGMPLKVMQGAGARLRPTVTALSSARRREVRHGADKHVLELAWSRHIACECRVSAHDICPLLVWSRVRRCNGAWRGVRRRG